MRRSMMVLVVVGLLGTMLLESASAGTPTVRRDSDDSSGGYDIRIVSTDTTPTHAVLWIGMWDRLHASPGVDLIIIPMDTHSTRRTDRRVTIIPEGHRCTVWDDKGSGRYIGRRPARRRGERSIGCKLPLGWFDIDKAVRFRVWAAEGHPDLAPNDLERIYVGL